MAVDGELEKRKKFEMEDFCLVGQTKQRVTRSASHVGLALVELWRLFWARLGSQTFRVHQKLATSL